MADIRGEEAWASDCISAAFGGVEVRLVDDGSRPGLHDFDIVYADRPPGAVEVTAAADSDSIELWKIVNDREDRWIVRELAGGWMVELTLQARGRRVLAELPDLLKELEQLGVRRLNPHATDPGLLEEAAASLGISRLTQGETDYPGSIYVTLDLPPERSGGAVAPTGDALAEWLGDWLREPEQADNLRKLERSGAQERHLFAIVPGFTSAPFVVSDLLWRSEAPLPTIEPNLPAEITHVWAMSTWADGDGMRWSPDLGWERFDKRPRQDV